MFDVNTAVREMITDALTPFHTRMYRLEQRDADLPEDAAVRHQVDRIIRGACIPILVTKAVNEAVEDEEFTQSVTDKVDEAIREAQIPQSIDEAILEADIEGKLEKAIEEADIDNAVECALADAITNADIKKLVEDAIQEYVGHHLQAVIHDIVGDFLSNQSFTLRIN